MSSDPVQIAWHESVAIVFRGDGCNPAQPMVLSGGGLVLTCQVSATGVVYHHEAGDVEHGRPLHIGVTVSSADAVDAMSKITMKSAPTGTKIRRLRVMSTFL
jgi:hypothetical protein